MTSSPTAPPQKPDLRPPPEPANKPLAELATSRASVDKAAQRGHFRGWPAWLGAIVALLLVAGIYWQSTYVSGIEINSHTWEQRGFSLRRDPFTGVQLTAVQHNAPLRSGLWRRVANPHAQTLPLAIGQYLSKSPALPLRWDLVRLEQSSLPGGGASILVELLKAHDRNSALFWPQWSTDHPHRAALLWPAAQHLVEFHKYEHLPALLNLALLENSAAELQQSTGQLVQTALLEYCQQQNQQGRHNSARQAARVGLQYGPDHRLQEFATAAP